MWETTAGCAVAGEDSITAALREVREEVGLELDPADGVVYKEWQPFPVRKTMVIVRLFPDLWISPAREELMTWPNGGEISAMKWKARWNWKAAAMICLP